MPTLLTKPSCTRSAFLRPHFFFSRTSPGTIQDLLPSRVHSVVNTATPRYNCKFFTYSCQTKENEIPATKASTDQYLPEHEFSFTLPSRSIRPNQRATTLPSQLISPTAGRLVQPRLEKLGNPFRQPPSKRKTSSSAYNLLPFKRTRESRIPTHPIPSLRLQLTLSNLSGTSANPSPEAQNRLPESFFRDLQKEPIPNLHASICK